MRLLYSLFAVGLAFVAGPAAAQITVANAGDWSDPTTWSTGAVPTASDDVVIEDSTVTIDITDAVANNVTIRGAGWLRYADGGAENVAKGLTVYGDLVIDGPDAELRPLSNEDDAGVGLGEIYHRLTVHGSIDNSTGGTFDMRRGATSTTPASAAFVDLIFAGGEDATFELGDYDSNDNQLFRTEIAKENGATVTLLSDATIDNNSRATFTLTSGYLDTGDYRFTLISNNSSVVEGGSPASYVIGELARGLPKGTPDSQTSRFYPVGDADAYRPVSVYVTDRPSDDQFFGVRVIPGAANQSSTLEGDLTAVSPKRYFGFTWYNFDTEDPVTIDRVEISYGADDQVPEGSGDFVVAASADTLQTWTNVGGFDTDGTTAHVTSLASPPTMIQSMDVNWEFEIGFDISTLEFEYDTYYAAIGTTSSFGTAAQDRPVVGALGLTAAPNPSAGIADLTFSLDEPSDVSVEVYDVLGRRVATLVEGTLPAGDQSLTWEAGDLSSGIYVVRLQAGTVAASQTITLAR